MGDQVGTIVYSNKFCSNCGEPICPDRARARYCWNCGNPVQGAEWEHCEIVYTYVIDNKTKNRADFTFVAKAIGPKGNEYTVAKSSNFTLKFALDVEGPDLSPKQTSASEQALNDLESRLLDDGWELIGVGNNWFNHQFRHRLS